MARIRTVKPEFFSDEKIASCSFQAQLLAIAILQLADKEGKFRWIAMQVHAHAFPYREDLDINAIASELEEIGYIRTYCVDGKKYVYIPGFTDHQRITGTEAKTDSKCPSLPEETMECFQEKQQSVSNGFPGKGRGKGSRKEEREREREVGKGISREREETAAAFATFWDIYPRKTDRKKALAAWMRHVKPGQCQQILDAIALQKQTQQWKGDGGKFIPHPTTWLNGERWRDEISEAQFAMTEEEKTEAWINDTHGDGVVIEGEVAHGH